MKKESKPLQRVYKVIILIGHWKNIFLILSWEEKLYMLQMSVAGIYKAAVGRTTGEGAPVRAVSSGELSMLSAF